jgi:hypothetical protein
MISSVLSVDPSLTMTQRSGRTVWPVTDRTVLSRKASSFLAGVIKIYFGKIIEELIRVCVLDPLGCQLAFRRSLGEISTRDVEKIPFSAAPLTPGWLSCARTPIDGKNLILFAERVKILRRLKVAIQAGS